MNQLSSNAQPSAGAIVQDGGKRAWSAPLLSKLGFETTAANPGVASEAMGGHACVAYAKAKSVLCTKGGS